MKKTLFILSMLVMAVCVALPSSAKSPKETVVFTVVPQMTCQNCENKIKSNLRFEKGVSDIVTDLETQTVTVTYDPEKTNKENLTAAFGKIGYTASEGAAEAPKCGKKAGCKKAEGKACCGKKAEGQCSGKKEGGHCGACKH